MSEQEVIDDLISSVLSHVVKHPTFTFTQLPGCTAHILRLL